MDALPVEAARPELLARVAEGPVVLSAPTGSGKSTQVPRWLSGRVLVVEPRRVACRALAQRVAELEGVGLGEEVGYRVRDEHRATASTRVVFATPGVVLGAFDRVAGFETVILDELHERRLDVDLLLALLARDRGRGLIAMSATLDGDRVAAFLGGSHVRAEGRAFPVEVRHAPGGALLPEARGVEARVRAALDAARGDPGDVLVFLPGKAEIGAVAAAISDTDVEVVTLHGGLTLDEQARAFRGGARRRVILATNVAETSVTVPGVGVVIDSGLVRRTRYHQGRGFLSLSPIAMDSADQRAGRAGRTMPGVCYRLWDAAARLEARTPPEVHRESVVPLVLGAAACGASARTLAFLDAPKDYALDAAEEELRALGALDPSGELTAAGRELHGLPLEPGLGRLLVEARARGTLDDAVDLVAALAVARPMFVGPRPDLSDDEDDLRRGRCDALALIAAVRVGEPGRHGLSRLALSEARANARRLRRALGLSRPRDEARPVDRHALAATALRADPRQAFVPRARKSRIAWANGATELELGRDSAVDPAATEAIVVLASRAVSAGRRATRVVATQAMPVKIAWMLEAGLGRDRLDGVTLAAGRVVARVSRVHAKKVLATREEEPEGAVAREAIRDLALRGSVFRRAMAIARERHQAWELAARVSRTHLGAQLGLPPSEPPEPLAVWLLGRLEALGVTHGADLSLLSGEDLLPDDLPWETRAALDRELPRRVDLGDATYEVEYDLPRRLAILRIVEGRRQSPPPRSFLPRLGGFAVCIEAGGSMHHL